MSITSPKKRFRILQWIHVVMSLSMALLLAISLLLNTDRAHVNIVDGNHPEIYAAIIMGIVAFLGSNFIYQRKLAEIDLYTPVADKFPQYGAACIIRYLLIGGGGFFNVVVWILTGNLIPACITGMLLLYLFILRPVKSRITKELHIEYPDVLE